MLDYQYRLKSFSERSLESIRQIIAINDTLHQFIKTSLQEDLDKVISMVENFDNSWVVFKESLEPLIKMVAGIESDEVKVNETENGYEL